MNAKGPDDRPAVASLRENLRTCQPNPTIMLAAELAVRNEIEFTDEADPQQRTLLGLLGALRCEAEEAECG